MIGRHGVWFAALALAETFACAGCSSTRSETDADANAAPAACAWPTSLDRMDGSTGQCVAARTYLSCAGSDGSGETCLSDDPVQCPDPSPISGATFGNCRDLCNPGEYAVACGGPGPGPWPSPPAACRILPPNPGGGSVACCPCDADGHPPDAAGDLFACGDTMTCDATAQVCEHVAGGAPPGVDFYSCTPTPTACTADVSCTCVTAALRSRGAGGCTATGSHVTVQINVP
jgi:hypothetical protein